MIEATSLLPFVAGCVAAILAVIGLTMPADPLRATTYFGLLCATTGIWAFAHFALLNTTASASPLSAPFGSLPYVLGVTTLIGVGGAPTYWFLFAAAATGRRPWLTRSRVAGAHVPFVYLIVVGATNPWHHLYASVDPATGTSSYGPLAWLHLFMALAMVVVGLGWMVTTWWTDEQQAGRRRAIVIGMTSVVVLASGLAHVGRTALGGEGMDPAPALFAILAIAMAYELFRSGYSALQIPPEAGIAETISDAMIVLDTDLRIHSLNSVARRLLSGLEPGSRLSKAAPEIAQHAEYCLRYDCDDMAFEATVDGSVVWGRVRRSQDPDGDTNGVVVLLTDLTQLRQAQDALLGAGRDVQGELLTETYRERLTR